MRYRKQSSGGDYTFGHSQDDFYQDEPNAVAQAVMTRLKLWRGEWYLDTDEGTQLIEGVLGKNKDTADATIQQRVLDTEGVTGISFYQSSIDPNTRAMTVNITVDTIYGPTTVQVQNYANF